MLWFVNNSVRALIAGSHLKGARQNGGHVHAEVVYPEQQRRSNRQDAHSNELGEGDASHDRCASTFHGCLCPLLPGIANKHQEVVASMPC